MLGSRGMPRRYYDYLPQFTQLHQISTVGSWILGMGFVIILFMLIRSLQKRIGVTSVVVTHDLHSAWKVGDRLALLHEGRVQFTGTPAEAEATSDMLMRQFIEGRSEGPVRAV